MEVLVLGPVRAQLDGRDAPLRGGRERGFLSALALAGPDGVDTHRLVDLVWGADAPPSAARTAAAYLSRLRAVLGPGAILTTAGRHRLSGADVDLWRFEELRSRGRAVPAEARACLGEALALWRDRAPATDATLDGAAVELASLSRARIDTAEALVGHLDDASAVDLAEETLREDPFREKVWLALARALDRLGRPAEALHAVRRARRALVEELGLDPSPALRDLESDLLNRRDPYGRACVGDRGRDHSAGLPFPLSGLIGRDEQRDDITALLSTQRLVTLTGAGGIGKSRLALAVAHDAVRHLGLEGRLVDLTAAASAGDVHDTLLRSVGIDPLGGDVIEAVEAGLGTRRVLLLVDSCEHVVTIIAPLLAHTLARCPRVQVLATSRVPMGVPGEVIVEVRPLELPADEAHALDAPAVRLLAARAAETAGTTAWGGAQARAAAAICTLLDGIPLAIELAARQLRYAPPDVVLRDLLHERDHGGATLEPFSVAVARSADLLPEPARAALRRLALLHGPVPVDVATAVAGDRAAVRALVDSSLLVSLGGAVRMYEPVRQYAARLLPQHEREQVRAIIAEAITSFTERAAPHLIGPDEVVWLASMDLVRDDVRAVLRWADLRGEDETLTRLTVAVGYLWMLGWGAREGREWVARALQRAAPPAARARLLVWATMMSLRWGELDAARDQADSAVALARQLDDDGVLGLALAAAGQARMRPDEAADVSLARELLDQAVLVRRRAGDVAGAAMSLGTLADLEVREGRLERAAERYAIGLPLMRASRSERGLLAYLHSMSELAVLRGDTETAESLVAEAQPLAVRTGDLWHVGLLAVVAATAGRDRAADASVLRDLAATVLTTCQAQTDPVVILDGIDVIAGILLDTNDAPTAGRLLRASRCVREERRLPISADRARRREADERAATRAAGAPVIDTPHDLDWLVSAASEALR